MGFPHFNGGVAVVTGGAAGIGKALSRQLRNLGMTVVIADLPGATLTSAALELGVTGIAVDVSDPGSVDTLAREVQSLFGSIQLLCNNAGVGSHKGFTHLTLEDWRWMMDVNFWGLVHGTRAFLPLLRNSSGGAHLLNTLSLLSLHSRPGAAAYSASKYAALAVTEATAAEFALAGDLISVTAFCPGPVDTTIAESAGRRDIRYGVAAAPSISDDPIQRHFLSTGRHARMSADDAAIIAVQAIRDGRFWAITHPELMDAVHMRYRGMAD